MSTSNVHQGCDTLSGCQSQSSISQTTWDMNIHSRHLPQTTTLAPDRQARYPRWMSHVDLRSQMNITMWVSRRTSHIEVDTLDGISRLTFQMDNPDGYIVSICTISQIFVYIPHERPGWMDIHISNEYDIRDGYLRWISIFDMDISDGHSYPRWRLHGNA